MPRHITNGDKVPIFRAYLGPNDILYLNPRHDIGYDGFSVFMSAMIEDSTTRIPCIALSTDIFTFENGVYVTGVLEELSCVKTSQIILVRRDACCWNGGKHSGVVEFVEGVETRAERAIVETVQRLLEENSDDLLYLGLEDWNPEVTTMVARWA